MARSHMFCFSVFALATLFSISTASESDPQELELQVRVLGVRPLGPSQSPTASVSKLQEILPEIAQSPTARRLGRHHTSDKSVAGGGVILGGLATTVIIAVFAYIRVTRSNGGQTA
ncbi:hypothetical protein AMTRI_Chr02g260550 [Amborella trichopoda]